jgi:predicted CxxxxCH...CXXCH cytochrome family protein
MVNIMGEKLGKMPILLILLAIIFYACDSQVTHQQMVETDHLIIRDQFLPLTPDQQVIPLDQMLIRDLSMIQVDQNIVDQAIMMDQSIVDQAMNHQRFHPVGYQDPLVHGLEFKLNTQNCRECHGNDLTGGSALSCDGCHPQEWKSNCTFCHGNAQSGLSAPPRDLRNQTLDEQMTFIPHAQHISSSVHGNWDCNQCHKQPVDIFSDQHIFDDSPGKAEVSFALGLSTQGVYNGQGGCSNLYCHGNGNQNGAYQHDAVNPGCDGCHPRAQLGGEHQRHRNEGLPCSGCHQQTVNEQEQITNAQMHVNGQKEILFETNQLSQANGFCNGICHGKIHFFKTW